MQPPTSHFLLLALSYFDRTTPLGLLDFNTIREGIFEFIEMGDNEYLCKIIFHEIDSLDESLTALHILRAKAFVDNKSLQARAFALCKDFGEGEPNGKVDSECLAA